MSINKVFLTGNLTRDGELRTTASGVNVLNFGLAVNDRVRNASTGEWEDYPNFINCVMFGPRAEKVVQYLKKGLKVSLCGRLRYSSWDADGQKRSKLEVIADDVEFMNPRPSNGGTPDASAYSAPSTPIANVEDFDGEEVAF